MINTKYRYLIGANKRRKANTDQKFNNMKCFNILKNISDIADMLIYCCFIKGYVSFSIFAALHVSQAIDMLYY